MDMNVTVNKTGIDDKEKIADILKKEGFISVYTWSDSPGTGYGWHSHIENEVRWVFKGSIEIGSSECEVKLEPGDKLEIKAGTKHWAKTEQGVSYYCGSK